MIEMTSYDYGDKVIDEYKLPEKITDFEVSYDGGRLTVYVNGEEVFYTALAGNDFTITVSQIKQPGRQAAKTA